MWSSTCLWLCTATVVAQGLFCDPAGQLALFSNYDGGRLTIVVDEDIPDLRIGVVSYEFARIIITGPYAGNVVAVAYAGFDAGNDHCALGGTASTTITGVDPGLASVAFYPPSPLPDPFGWPAMVCAYSCGEGVDQGGCNTAAQVAAYFVQLWGGSVRFHRTQYGCWGDAWAISEGGNCCSGVPTGLPSGPVAPVEAFFADGQLVVADGRAFTLMDAMGRVVMTLPARPGGAHRAATAGMAGGLYTLRADDGALVRLMLAP